MKTDFDHNLWHLQILKCTLMDWQLFVIAVTNQAQINELRCRTSTPSGRVMLRYMYFTIVL